MMSSSDLKNNSLDGGEIQESANVNKIRDILFGAQMRDYEQRFARLEERLSRTADDLREEMRKHIGSLESFARGEFESLAQRLKAERTGRAGAVEDLRHEAQESSKTLEKRLVERDEQVESGQSDLRSRILDQSKIFSEEIESLRRDLTADLERQVNALRGEKIDRAALADLLNELALRLRDQLSLPQEEATSLR